jgi:OOP family OmpA-OmpF porin
MKLVNGFFVLAAVVLMAGCSGGMSPPEVLTRAEPVGSPFTKYLAVQYNTMAHNTHGADEVYFSKKGLAAIDGMIVEPESLKGRDISGSEAIDMAEARGELMTLLNDGGRSMAPDLAAVAQVRFDCWVTMKGGSFLRRSAASYPGESVSCQQQFYATINSLKQALAGAPPPVMTQPPPAEEFPSPVTYTSSGGASRATEAPSRQLSYLVFFDWNASTVSPGADDVLETVAHEIRNSDQDIHEIIVDGYTDASGGEKYNLKLSQKRANAVRERLAFYGIQAKKIHASGHGSKDMLVKTPRGVREPQNRRVQITFE